MIIFFTGLQRTVIASFHEGKPLKSLKEENIPLGPGEVGPKGCLVGDGQTDCSTH